VFASTSDKYEDYIIKMDINKFLQQLDMIYDIAFTIFKRAATIHRIVICTLLEVHKNISNMESQPTHSHSLSLLQKYFKNKTQKRILNKSQPSTSSPLPQEQQHERELDNLSSSSISSLNNSFESQKKQNRVENTIDIAVFSLQKRQQLQQLFQESIDML
jgi:hypothetical protein